MSASSKSSLQAQLDYLRRKNEIEDSAAACKASLAEFTRRAWNELEPATPLVWNWHIDAMAEHLMAVSRGDIKRLLCNVPPGHMKSLMFCVMWPAWQWAHSPHYRLLFASYSSHLSTRDTLKCTQLMRSQWYRERFGDAFKLTKANEDKVYNDKTGFRIATSVGGVGTGERVHVVVNDDLVRANDDESEAKLDAALKHMKAMSTRGVNPAEFAQVLIMQRISEYDPAGYAIEQGNWEQLILPAEYDSARHCTTSIGFSDPRGTPGHELYGTSLLWPQMFPQETLDAIKTSLGSKDSAAQLQQLPTPPGGGMFMADRIHIVDYLPNDLVQVRGWDLAATDEKDNPRADYTCGGLLARDKVGRFYICDMQRFRKSPHGVAEALMETAEKDGSMTPISGPQDPGAAGKTVALAYTSMLAGYDVEFTPETGDKRTRAKPLAAQVEAGNVYMLRGDWNRELIDELGVFPHGKHDDQVDSLSRAFHRLLEIEHTGGVVF